MVLAEAVPRNPGVVRLAVGERVTLIFENRETIRFHVQEMLRVERISNEAPQAQCTVSVLYSGWISGCMAVLLRRYARPPYVA